MPRAATTQKNETEPLSRYRAKRDFKVTPEPPAEVAKKSKALSFVIQKHWATRLHYDFRLELDGVLLSWAVPKGPSFDPKDKRMAIHVEDHPVSYGGFEGTIPPRQYGAGKVIVWDRGTWEPEGDPRAGMKDGKLVFRLRGEKLAGLWELIRIAKPGDRQEPWLLFKKRDEWARPNTEYDVVAALPDSVVEQPLGLLEEREPRGAAAEAAEPVDDDGATDLPGAKKATLPDSLEPQLATLAKEVPTRGDWIYELKFDGYRLLARLDAKGKAKLFTRKGNDWTSKMKPLAEAIEAMGVRSSWLDGEIVVLDDNGVPSFNLLQNAFDNARTSGIVYYLFDAPFFEGHDLRGVPLKNRRALVRQLVENHGSETVRLSEAFSGNPAHILEGACKLKLEGIIAKRADARYVSERSEAWLKLKCQQRQEFIVVGYTEREGSGREIGSLLLAYHDDLGALRTAGSVGTGWNAETAADLRKLLVKLATDKPAIDPATVVPGRWSKRSLGAEHWVKPELVVEVSYGDWTPDGKIRHAKYVGLRDDKPAEAISREKAVDAPGGGTAPSNKVGSVKVSNPERVIDPSTGLKKLDLVRYYESVAEWMLPHLKGRPVSLVRGPSGITGQLFFQKHDDKLSIPHMRELDAKLWPGHDALLEVPTAQALVSAAQMNVIEFHTWNSTAKKIDQPDRIVFDLDPGEGVKWPQVQEAALLTRALLDELKLQAWLKTSGGKGLHVIVPIAPKFDYDTVKDFSEAVVQHLAKTIPSRFVAKSGAGNRIGRIFVDYLRNGFGATTAAAFSARARPGLGVSMPIAWEQLKDLKSGAQWSIATAREYLSFQKSDPWADYWASRQSLTSAMKAIGFTPPKLPKR